MRTETKPKGGALTGTTMDCLKHYLAKLPWGGKGDAEARKPLSAFTGVRSETIRQWYVREILPKGLELVKLRYFLENEGYRVVELDLLLPEVRKLGGLIAFGTIGYEETAKRIGLVQNDRLLQVLHGNRGLAKDRMEVIARICAVHPSSPETGAKSGTNGAAQQPLPASGGIPVAPTKVEEEILCLLDTLSGLCALLAPRLDHMLSNEVTSAQRQAFRDAAGRHRVFDMSNRFHNLGKSLNALCSEKAREITSTSR